MTTEFEKARDEMAWKTATEKWGDDKHAHSFDEGFKSGAEFGYGFAKDALDGSQETVGKLAKRIAELEKHLALALSFAPKGPVPEGLSPEFYHTLDYNEEVKLQARIDDARKALSDSGRKEESSASPQGEGEASK